MAYRFLTHFSAMRALTVCERTFIAHAVARETCLRGGKKKKGKEKSQRNSNQPRFTVDVSSREILTIHE